jgi:NTE family protein
VTETELVSPVSLVPDEVQKPLEDGVAICLSGGGYRAMLFHTGVLWRLIRSPLWSRKPLANAADGSSGRRQERTFDRRVRETTTVNL